MIVFGMEIRKAGDISALYRDVDLVISKIDSKVLVRQTVAHALQKMLKPDSYFCVCTIDRCVDVCGKVIPKERYNIYHACHCIHWNEMLPDFRTSLIAMVFDDFREILNPV